MEIVKTKKVLIALDNDSTAQKIAEKGYALAKEMNAQIILLNVISDLVSYAQMEYSSVQGRGDFQNVRQFQQNNAEAAIKESQIFLNDSKKLLSDKTVQIIVKIGDYANTILKTAKDYQVDIIVMGSQSLKWIDKIIMGSVTEKVLYHTLVPLYIVPTREQKIGQN